MFIKVFLIVYIGYSSLFAISINNSDLYKEKQELLGSRAAPRLYEINR